MKIGDSEAVGIAVATTPTGNVVTMAEAVAEAMKSQRILLPEGMEIHCLYDQGKESATANDGFILNLILSVITVVAILLFFIGYKNGLLVGSGLVFSIFFTLIYMWMTGIALQRMSLAAIIIAMGMLADNAIVVFDSTLNDIRRGRRKRPAILRSVSATAIPLLAATMIAVLTFLPVYLSPHITGELLSSLFIVIAVSLTASWIFSITQTPFFIQEFVPRPREIKEEKLFTGRLYDRFRSLLNLVIRRKTPVCAGLVLLLILAVAGFGKIPKVFMPQLNKQYFTLDLWTPEGSRIEHTARECSKVADFLLGCENVRQVSSFIGQTPPRYYLANTAYGPQPNYAQCLVEADSPRDAFRLQKKIEQELPGKFPGLLLRVNRFELNSIPTALIEARFCGDDPAVLDSLTRAAMEIMRRDPEAVRIRNEWGNMAPCIRTEFDPIRAGRLGLGKQDLTTATKALGDGVPIGIFRDREKQLPVLLTIPAADSGLSSATLQDLPVWNGERSAPLGQLTGTIGVDWEWPTVRTYNRRLSMAAQCDVSPGSTMAAVRDRIAPAIEQIRLPEGYSFFWDSQYKDQREATEALTRYFPLAIILLILILIALFGNFRDPLLIFLILPLSLIGVIFGLRITGFTFGFFSIAGWLGLLGMIIKNVIVLLDEINRLRKDGYNPGRAVIEATVSRTRPVLMAASTTVCGMIPLLFDVVFGSMAATIVFGLTFATLLTLVATPALYAVLHRIEPLPAAELEQNRNRE